MSLLETITDRGFGRAIRLVSRLVLSGKRNWGES
jgi:hypothetical protein